MSVSYIPETVKLRLWGKTAGCCQYEGCNDQLWVDSLTKAEFNTAYIAHIIADSPDGPRGDPILSPQLKREKDLDGIRYFSTKLDAMDKAQNRAFNFVFPVRHKAPSGI